MEHFVNQFGGWAGIAAFIIVGIFAIIGMVDKSTRARRKEVAELLKEQVDALEGKVELLSKQVEELKKENETLIRVLQGRDEQTQLFYKKGFESMKTIDESLSLMKVMNDKMDVIRQENGNVGKLIGVVNKQLP